MSKSQVTTTAARLLLGAGFVTFGLNGFLQFLPQPATLPENVNAFTGALVETGYMMPLVFGTQLVAGALLVLGLFVPLALALLAPLIVHIVAFHWFLDRETIAPGLVVLALELYLAFAYRHAFAPMLAPVVKPGPRNP